MIPDEIRDRFNAITVWKRGDERAPHKPRLALCALGRVRRAEPRAVDTFINRPNCDIGDATAHA